ncbi:hypothetical protein [Streptomyces sp. NRRL S-1813]|uniref:hypothetical protein n=1 Tax=Streptomyces sp. NRRL S-1813 TaxID=1463888 RepID=UPI00131EC150|nr:hypothetical protein [Streptomyces sp. NRRL S-1813]
MDSHCACGSNLGLRLVSVDTATGPAITVTCCGACATGAVVPPVPDGVARILARRAGIRLPGDPQQLRPKEGRRG